MHMKCAVVQTLNVLKPHFDIVWIKLSLAQVDASDLTMSRFCFWKFKIFLKITKVVTIFPYIIIVEKLLAGKPLQRIIFSIL